MSFLMTTEARVRSTQNGEYGICNSLKNHSLYILKATLTNSLNS